MDSEAQKLCNKLWRDVVSPCFMSSMRSDVRAHHVYEN
jgi:hypothetical protein